MKVHKPAKTKGPSGPALAKRPPKEKAGVANDVYSSAPRSAMMPPPRKDTKTKRGPC